MIPALPTSDDHVEYEICPERRLMLAVLLTAILDAAGENTGTTNRRDRDLVRGTALGWLKYGGEDFEAVCELAGVEPRYIRRAALNFIASDTAAPRMRRASQSRSVPRTSKQKAPAHV